MAKIVAFFAVALQTLAMSRVVIEIVRPGAQIEADIYMHIGFAGGAILLALFPIFQGDIISKLIALISTITVLMAVSLNLQLGSPITMTVALLAISSHLTVVYLVGRRADVDIVETDYSAPVRRTR